jgi:hypothetical protein
VIAGSINATTERHATTSATMPASYALYGLHVVSDTILPVPVSDNQSGLPTDLAINTICTGDAPEPDGRVIAWAPCAIHGADAKVTRGDAGTWIWHRAIGTFHVSPDARSVNVYPNDGVDPRAVGLALTGPVALYALHRHGLPSLHATAVCHHNRVVAFLGDQGQGKSTMAAGFVADGATLLTDDALPIEIEDGIVYGRPGLPFMKVWTATAEHALGLTEDLPELMNNYEKKYLDIEGRFQFANTRLPLDMVLLLNRYDPAKAERTDTTITRLSGTDSVAILLAHTSNRSYLLSTEQARFLKPYATLASQVPVAVLTYPSGFEHQPAVRQHILEHLT